MKTTFGQFNSDGGDGFLRPVYFPSLATMDQWTGDGRRLSPTGGGVYGSTLPRPIKAQFVADRGHSGSVPVGSLQEITLHDNGNISGRGWLTDIEEAHKLVTLVKTQALFHNSIDMADVVVEIDWKSDDPADPGFWEMLVDFVEWKIAATTFVDIPAFSNAHGTLDAPSEIMASAMMKTDEPVTIEFASTRYEIQMAESEITASDNLVVPFADFHIPEVATHTPIWIDENGRVYGHLALWGQCHGGITDRCVLAPRPASYAAFCQPGVLTERGIVETGPIFFLGGHPEKPLGNGDRWKAYGGIENAWADVRVTNGVIGPWVSGRVRPGLSAEAVYMARASRISGHWLTDGNLSAIVSCNVPAFNIPGSGMSVTIPGSTMRADRDGVRIEDGKVVELVASLHAPTPEVDPLAARAAVGDRWAAALSKSLTWVHNPPSTGSVVSINYQGPVEPAPPDFTQLATELELELELDS